LHIKIEGFWARDIPLCSISDNAGAYTNNLKTFEEIFHTYKLTLVKNFLVYHKYNIITFDEKYQQKSVLGIFADKLPKK
jgi:hypothetical protein